MKYSREQLARLSLEELKKLREQHAKGSERTRAPALARQARPSALPLSYSQERLWFLEQLGIVGPAHNTGMALRLEGALDVEALQRSLQELVRRHETLRTRFESLAGSPVQVVDSSPQFVLQVEDLSELAADEQARRVRQAGEVQAREPFDLTKAPLLRVVLLRLSLQEHVLLITIHHIVFDGWSWEVLQRELGALYGAYSHRQPLQLDELPIQYADYALWQRQYLHDDTINEQLQYWKERLRGAPPQLELPTDWPRPPVASFNGARLSTQLPAQLLRGLTELAGQSQATLFMVVLAAYQVLLSRFSGQRDIVIGSPIAGRVSRELEGLIGFFINMLALRTEVAPDATFREILQQVKDVTLDAYARQDVPFDKLVQELRLDRSLTRQPLVQVTLAFQNYPEAHLELPGLSGTWTALESATSHFDLTLYLYQRADGLDAIFEYATDLFDSGTIARMAACFRVLLEGIVANPDREVAQLPLLDERQREQVLRHFNDTSRAYPSNRTLPQLVEAQVARTPQATAVVCGNEQITYLQLNRRADRLARVLIGLGVVPESLVAVFVERSVGMVVGLLAILKAGGAYVPLDSSYPTERLAVILRDSAPVVVLTQRGLCDRLPRIGNARTVLLDECSEAMSDEPQSEVATTAIKLQPEHLAYVIYTSGSTGLPKGVLVDHRNVVNFVCWHGETFDIVPGCRSCSVASLGFDAVVWEIWGALSFGGTLVLPTDAIVANTHALLEWWAEEQLDISFLPTPMAEFALSRNIRNRTLRTLLVGGDRLRYPPGEEPFEIINNYGPTETTVVATSGRMSGAEPVLHIGRPIANTQIYILDACQQPVPVGVTGEIHIGGSGVARGYLNRPELTQQRFIRNPFSHEKNARLYKSGDLARWRADGTIEYLGRNDDQVKIRGYRIEPGEIEAQLLQHPMVREAVVLAREERAGDKRLVAYVTSDAVGEASTADGCTWEVGSTTRQQLIEQLREHLRRSLPEYMIPVAWVVLDRFPLTKNGKLDRGALPPPLLRSEDCNDAIAPRTELEHALVRIWSEVLRVDAIGVRDNFFELGGHSLLATQVVARVQSQLSASISTRLLFEAPTIERLAARLADMHQAHLPEQLAAASAGDIEDLLDIIADMPESTARELLRKRTMEGRP